ncbi:LEC-like protein [Mya arenaria]|uniref:LEC-like protein n=1 Tax=Mya arenaria TaxID=6604 RepID=A0ABY7G8H0_MYAAR|nr:galactose-binding lectin-like [Mya arenaria]XP_052785480.1 galactose-binding lectin-like [Mya arenaria]XP_052785481.1 galactose-binding lectin-like [Mya arenaria]WAR29326.1 LEC-like protein [Mya arenaria]
MSEPFLIKHRSSGRFLHVSTGKRAPSDDTEILFHGDIHDNMYWRFCKETDYWGYIEHVNSGKVIHPHGGGRSPANGTKLVVHGGRHYGALFALDGKNDHVIHKDGKYAHPENGRPDPGNSTKVVLHSDVHDAMRFQFVSPKDPSKNILVYGSPNVIGKWEIINAVINPRAEHKSTISVKIGKSKTNSTTSTFEYTWEASMGVEIKAITASVSQSLRSMIEKTSSETWTEETTRTKEITVSPGKTVVTWQYKFSVEQNDSRALFQSNLLADTDSETTVPRDFKYLV